MTNRRLSSYTRPPALSLAPETPAGGIGLNDALPLGVNGTLGGGTNPSLSGNYATSWGAPYGLFGQYPTTNAASSTPVAGTSGGNTSGGGGSYWQPAEFDRPATPYPGTGAPVRRGRSSLPSISIGGMYVPPEQSLGTGAYWPGHNAERAKQQQDSWQNINNAVALGNNAAVQYFQAQAHIGSGRPWDSRLAGIVAPYSLR